MNEDEKLLNLHLKDHPVHSHKGLPVAREGLPYIIKFLAVAFLLVFFPWTFIKVLGWSFFALAVFCVFFFRDPERKSFYDPSFILAPGDGRVLEVSEENSDYFGGPAKTVKIFLSIFNVHVQRSPVQGKVAKIEYRKGKFLDARDRGASLQNEQNAIFIENDKCKVVVKQIAGFIARRIVCWVRELQTVNPGQRIGLIRFGSQVDLILPPDAEVLVKKGDSVIGGVSLIAHFSIRGRQ